MSVCSLIFTIFINISYLSLHGTASYKFDFPLHPPPPLQSNSPEFQLGILESNNLSTINQDSYSSAHLSMQLEQKDWTALLV